MEKGRGMKTVRKNWFRTTKWERERGREEGEGENEKETRREVEGERKRFSHVTTPHVRRQIFTYRLTMEGREARQPMRRQSMATVYTAYPLFLSLSLLLSIHQVKILRDVVQDFLFSEILNRDLGDTLELDRVCSIIEKEGRHRKRGIKRTIEINLLEWKALRAFFMIVYPWSATSLSPTRLLVYAHQTHATRPVPPSGSRACDGRG